MAPKKNRPEGDEADYFDSRGGSTLIHRTAEKKPERELPFVLTPEEEEGDDVFTSAGWPDDDPPERPRRSLIYEKGVMRDASGADRADLLAGRDRPALPRKPSAPPEPEARPVEPVVYIPGKGIVPRQEDKKVKPPPLPPVSKRPSVPRPPPRPPRAAVAPRPQPPAPPAPPLSPPPQPPLGPPAPMAREEPVEEATQVSAPPPPPARRKSLEDVARLGALFSEEDNAVTNEIDLKALDKARLLREAQTAPVMPSPALHIPAVQAPAMQAPARLAESEEETRTEVAIRVTRPKAVSLARLGPAGQVLQTTRVEHGRLLMGRIEGDLLLFEDPTVSPWHAQVVVKRSGVFLKDMNSRNGVFVRLGREVALKDGDDLILGRQRLLFRDRWEEAQVYEDGTRALGSPDAAAPARLLLRRAGGEPGGVYFLGAGLLIGRERGDLLFPEDELLQPEHADIRRKGDTYTIRHLEPGADIFRAIRGEVELCEDDWFQVGQTRFRVLFEK